MIDHNLDSKRPIEEISKCSNKKVLVIDDERGVRESLEMVLKRDYEVCSAENGKKAMELLEREEIDLIITDIKLEQESGLDVMEEILRQYSDMRFIVISSALDRYSINRARRMGAQGFLDKPFKIEELLSIVRKTAGE